MTTKSKFALLAAFLAISAASPAFAQSQNDDQTTAAKLDEVTFHQVVPSDFRNAPVLVDYSDNPNAAGGGSYGYNNHVHHDYI
jgi:hypothetical protein